MKNVLQLQPFYLNQPLGASDVTIQVRGLKDTRGTAITAMPSGVSEIIVTIEPKSATNQEIISFTGITDNGNGIVTLTGVTRNLSPTDATATLSATVPHANNSICIVSDSPQALKNVVTTNETATITAVHTFSVSPIVPVATSAGEPVNKSQLDLAVIGTVPPSSTTVLGAVRVATDATKTLGNVSLTIATPCVAGFSSHGLTANDTIRFTTTGALPTGVVAGTTYYVLSTGLTSNTFQFSTTAGGSSVNTSGGQSGTHTLYRTTPYAINDQDTRLPTQGQKDASAGNNGTPSSTNTFVTQTGFQRASETYGADAGASDTYAITLSPVPSAYVAGMSIRFRANTKNTGGATLNVNSLGAITIVKGFNTTLEDNDIVAGQVCHVVYDGTNSRFILMNPSRPVTGTPSVFCSTDYSVSGRYTNTVTGTGAVGHGGANGGVLATGNGTASGGSASIKWNITHTTTNNLYLNNPIFTCKVIFTSDAATGSGNSFFGLGEPTVATSGHTFTVAHAGFKITKTGGVVTVYATQADGTTETASSALTTLVNNDYLELALKFNGSLSVDYYWRKNGGVMSDATTLSTNVPTTGGSSVQMSADSNSTSSIYTFSIPQATYQR